MLSKLLLTLAIAASFSNVYAADEATAAAKPKTFMERISLSYHGEFGLVRKNSLTENNVYRVDNARSGVSEGKLKDFTHFHNPVIGYKFDNNISLSSSFEFRYADHKGRPKFANRFYRALVTLSKSKILTEQDYGFQLDAGIARRYMDRTAVRDTYGNDRVNFTVTKNVGNNNGSLFVQYLANDPKDVDINTWRRTIELIPTINLQLTDKLSYSMTDDMTINFPWKKGSEVIDGDTYTTVNNVYFTHEFYFANITYKYNDLISPYLQLKYDFFDGGFTDASKYEDIAYAMGVSYSVTPKLTLTGELGSTLMASSDHESLFAKTASKPEFTLYVDASF